MRRSVLLLVLVGLVFVGLAAPALADAQTVWNKHGDIVGNVHYGAPMLSWIGSNDDPTAGWVGFHDDHYWACRRWEDVEAILSHPKKLVWTVSIDGVYLGRAVWDGSYWVLGRSLKGTWYLKGFCEGGVSGKLAAGALYVLWR